MDYAISPALAEKIIADHAIVDDVSPEDRRIARRLAELRNRHKLTPEEMSLATGVPVEEILAMESGECAVPAAAVFLISYRMNVRAEELLEIDGPADAFTA